MGTNIGIGRYIGRYTKIQYKVQKIQYKSDVRCGQVITMDEMGVYYMKGILPQFVSSSLDLNIL